MLFRSNYCTLNPIDQRGGASFSTGNLTGQTSNAYDSAIAGTFATTTGKWYCEMSMTANYAAAILYFGLYDITAFGGISGDNATRLYNSNYYWGYYTNDGKLYYTNVQIAGTSAGSTWGIGDVIGMAWDSDAGTIQFYKNGVAHPSTITGLTSKKLMPAWCNGTSGYQTFWANFGQRPFAYTAPSGFKALCTQNLPTPTIGLY